VKRAGVRTCKSTEFLDFDGMNQAYDQFFGTPRQPNKPVRATVQVAALVQPWGLVEIEVVAVRSR